jgi:cytochrome c biogenesis protein ResB
VQVLLNKKKIVRILLGVFVLTGVVLSTSSCSKRTANLYKSTTVKPVNRHRFYHKKKHQKKKRVKKVKVWA